MSDALPDGYVIHLPPPKPPRRIPHVFGDPRHVPAGRSVSGFEQHERTCNACGAVKVTIIDKGNNHRRAWRTSETAAQIETFLAPPCTPFAGAPT